jgi:hypothetical protein
MTVRSGSRVLTLGLLITSCEVGGSVRADGRLADSRRGDSNHKHMPRSPRGTNPRSLTVPETLLSRATPSWRQLEKSPVLPGIGAEVAWHRQGLARILAGAGYRLSEVLPEASKRPPGSPP